MSTDTNQTPVWDKERIAALREVAQRAKAGQNGPLDVWDEYDRATPPSTVLSLLDELEQARAAERAKNAELSLASEQLYNCVAELESARRERDVVAARIDAVEDATSMLEVRTALARGWRL